MMKSFLSMMLVCVLPCAVAAQHTPSSVKPDTLGANFTEADVGTAGPNDFDYLVGEWTFLFQNRQGPNSWGPPIPGKWFVRKTNDGLVVEDRWELEGAPDPTLTWRVYNPNRKLWELQGLKPKRGSWDPGTAWSSGNERFLLQTFAGVTKARIRYYDIRPDGFSWRADVSPDDGKTWIRDAWIMEAKRVR